MTAQSVRYTMVIQWSPGDDAYVVSLPEWEGRVLNPVTHGATYEEAAKHGLEVLEGIMAVSLEEGQPLPDTAEFRSLGAVSARTT